MRAIKIILLIFIVFLCSCGPTQRLVTQVEYRNNTEYQDRFIRDTIHESHIEKIYIKADTVYHTVTKIVYKEKNVHDTIISCKIDSIPYPVKVVEYVNKPLKNWQKSMIAIGFVAIGLLIITIVIKLK